MGIIDPELARLVRLYRRVDHRDVEHVRKEARRRARVAGMLGSQAGGAAGVRVRDLDAGGIRIRVYEPDGEPAGDRSAALYLHGGAFVSGDLDFEHPRCVELCREAAVVVVSVDYRLAPEHPYPAALDDCCAVLAWLRDAARSFAVDPGRIGVVGASAGGGLAAAMCLRLRDEGAALPQYQLLIYPVLDDRLATPSVREFADSPVWDGRNCEHMWAHYLGPGPAPPYAAPARADDLGGLPPAYVMTAELDPLRDEGIDYARRLQEAGVPTELHSFAGACHGFDTLADATVSRRARREHCEVLRAWAHASSPRSH